MDPEKELLQPHASKTKQTINNDIDIGEDDEMFDSEEYCIQSIVNGQNLWQCSICHLSHFRFKCLLKFHVINVHLKKKGCAWCARTFDNVNDMISHCQSCSCKAGEFKRLNKSISSGLINEKKRNTDDKNSVTQTAEESNTVEDIKEILVHSCVHCHQKFSSKKQIHQHLSFGRGCKMHQQKASKEKEDITKCYTIVADKTKKLKWLMYKCLTCNHLFPSQFVVKRHIRRCHWGIRKHSCKICKKSFFDIATLRYHRNSVLGCRNMEVALGIAIKHDEIPENESCDNINNEMFRCRVCKNVISGRAEYELHLKQEILESSSSKISCPSCHKKFSKKQGLSYHVDLVHCKQKLALEKAPNTKMQARKENLKKKTCRKKKVVIRCPICEIIFCNLQEKANHMNASHPEGSPIICNKCQRHYSSIVNLLYHKRVYHVDRTKTYKCPQCGFKTWNKYRLKQHSYRHTHMRDEMYKCEICSLVYDSAASLSRHKLIHSNVKNHVCSVCGKKFTQKCTLDRHLDSHKNIKRYKCAVCGQKYTQSYPLSKHVKSFHPDMFDTFQKERQTDKWKNDIPDSVKKQSKPIKTAKKECVTIIQVPSQEESKGTVPKYRYILMNSAGEIIRPEDDSIMEGLLDNDANNIRKSRILMRNSIAKNPLNKKAKKQISIILPPPSKSNVPVTNQSTDQSGPSVQATVLQMIQSADAMQRTDLADVSFGVSNNQENRLTVVCDQVESGQTFSLDTPSVLGMENLDFYLPLEMQDTFNNESDQMLALQNIPEDLWFDFTQANLDASTLLGSSYSLLGFNNQENELQSNLETNLSNNNPGLIDSSQNIKDKESDIVLPTLQDIPSWTGDQMLLVQDGDTSYLISANNLAHLDSINISNKKDLPSTSSAVTEKTTEESTFVMPMGDIKEVTVPLLKKGENLRSLLTRK